MASERVRARQGLRSSNAAGPHQDRRTGRNRARGQREQAAIGEQAGEGEESPGSVAELLDRLASRGDLELRFIQHKTSGKVHVIVPDDPDEKPMPLGSDTDSPFGWFGWLTGRTRTLCGYAARNYISGTGKGSDLPVSAFPDDALCWRCHRVLGPHSNRAFEHPTPSDDEEADRG